MPINIDEQIKFLNESVKCRLAPSPIHGVGVFAIRAIKKGEKMGCLGKNNEQWFDVPYSRFGEIREEVRGLILDRWPLVKQGSYFQSPNDDARLQSFMNEGNPNFKDDIALRNISKGEEILEKYTDI